MILISKYIVPKGYTGIALFPFLILKSKKLITDDVLLNHEKIHLRQQLELLVIPFYAIYVLEFVIRFYKTKNWHGAYRAISFEKEAYTNEANLYYLKKRRIWGFINYF
ncbi:hypothetical protein [Winogradskyella alexanderae]|uniref:DUF4157 domain-containing protein n=1 Tax=Winogradskyella alexanderae TaxID=2877123 RepID=A0ABS7XTB2_9FLAO|nr:hypothetical protein [Winogradskyella alexanderae]MCA0133265.1 hypothetical protein [Winogradskyella alexanderae]